MRYSRLLLIFIMVWSVFSVIVAQDEEETPEPEVELIGGVQLNDGESAEGYVLFAPAGLTGTYLIDKDGQVINAWDSDYAPAQTAYLLEDGRLVRTGRRGTGQELSRVVEIFNWEGDVEWTFSFEGTPYDPHHDIEPMANGNVLVIAGEQVPMEEAVAMGYDSSVVPAREGEEDEQVSSIRLDAILEISPETNEIVWSWHSKDHVVQNFDSSMPNYGENPRRIDFNYHDIDDVTNITHINGIDYNEAADQIIVSARSVSELWVIDHSISTEEAKGPAGDLLYRWGNPAAYGSDGERQLYFQHDPKWIDPTSADSPLTVFSNGSEDYEVTQSQVMMFTLPTPLMDGDEFVAPEIVWLHTGDFFERIMSGVQALPNGNFLVTLTSGGRFIEITGEGDIVWEYINPAYLSGNDDMPTNRVFRAVFYPSDYPAFEGRDLVQQGELTVGIRR